MGLWNKLFGEFVDVIEWIDDSDDTMVYRFERYGNEIKYGAMLTVRESQEAILVNEGRIADLFEPGLYKLETANMPIMTTLESWPHGFNSPFKAEVYFFSMRRFTDLKWGTKNPVMLRDKEFGPVRLRAFGTYAVRIKEPVTFIKQIVGTDGHFRTGEITSQLRNLILSRFASILGESNIPILDLAANYDDLSDYITARIKPEFLEYGLEMTKLLVENISLPPPVEEAMDKRTSMGILGNLRDYGDFQAAEAMKAAADNPSGGASTGIGLGMGFAMAQQMTQRQSDADAASRRFDSTRRNGAITPPDQSQTQVRPPPIPEPAAYFIASDGRQTGPFDREAMRRKIMDGEMTQATLVWSQPLVEWTPAGRVAEFSELFAAKPPPIPKA